MAVYWIQHKLSGILKVLFCSKRCPICGEKMKIKIDKEKYIETGKLMSEYNFGQAYKVWLHRFCYNCKKKFEPLDLKYFDNKKGWELYHGYNCKCSGDGSDCIYIENFP